MTNISHTSSKDANEPESIRLISFILYRKFRGKSTLFQKKHFFAGNQKSSRSLDCFFILSPRRTLFSDCPQYCKADAGAKHIQNQVVYIADSPQGEKLNQLDCQNQDNYVKQKPIKGFKLFPQIRRQQSQRHKNRNIADQIDKNSGRLIRIRVLN